MQSDERTNDAEKLKERVQELENEINDKTKVLVAAMRTF